VVHRLSAEWGLGMRGASIWAIEGYAGQTSQDKKEAEGKINIRAEGERDTQLSKRAKEGALG
jgi:hypothetical protein